MILLTLKIVTYLFAAMVITRMVMLLLTKEIRKKYILEVSVCVIASVLTGNLFTSIYDTVFPLDANTYNNVKIAIEICFVVGISIAQSIHKTDNKS